ncbi:MAG: hypothetical protein QF594_01835 [Dehalococcoidales bacterium]|jgi:hypothetical protein|nr:hypothetical protein [Dehalococcoidales bacterium]|tara:strand:+ start:369 stop:560 length:192 start_codon:yes stop_codon:yes gene_type:complete
MIEIPPAIMAVAISRKTSIILLVADFTRKWGKDRFRISAYITTKMGRLLIIVETSDTGPFDSA